MEETSIFTILIAPAVLCLIFISVAIGVVTNKDYQIWKKVVAVATALLLVGTFTLFALAAHLH